MIAQCRCKKVCDWLRADCQQGSMAAPAARKHALSLKILAECSTTKARACDMTLPHQVVNTPVFMPVGTQGTLKGLIPEQLQELNCQIMLGNTYHLGHRPVSCHCLSLWLKIVSSLSQLPPLHLNPTLLLSINAPPHLSCEIFFPIILFLQGPDLLDKAGGLHKFMKWDRALLTVRSSKSFCYFPLRK